MKTIKASEAESVTPGFWIWNSQSRKSFMMWLAGTAIDGERIWHEKDGSFDIESNWIGEPVKPAPPECDSIDWVPVERRWYLDGGVVRVYPHQVGFENTGDIHDPAVNEKVVITNGELCTESAAIAWIIEHCPPGLPRLRELVGDAAVDAVGGENVPDPLQELKDAFSAGKTIQILRTGCTEWATIHDPLYDARPEQYRIKPKDPPKPKFAVGDWVEYHGHDWKFTGYAGDGRQAHLQRKGSEDNYVELDDLKRIAFRQFEIPEEFAPYRERWTSLPNCKNPLRFNAYSNDTDWKWLLQSRTWHSIHGDDWHGQPCGVREMEQ